MKTNAVPACPHCGRKGQGYKQQPTDYGGAQEWADWMLKTYEQLQCPGCQRYTIWKKVKIAQT